MKFDPRFFCLMALATFSVAAHADTTPSDSFLTDDASTADGTSHAKGGPRGFGGHAESRGHVDRPAPRPEPRIENHVRIDDNIRMSERARLDGLHATFRDDFFRLHPEVRADWRWEWRGGVCYGNGIVYGADFCRAGIGASYFWIGNECREYTPVGVFLAVASDFSLCGAPELRMHLGWNGNACWDYDIYGNAVAAVDLGFCRTELGTHFAFLNGACAELENGTDLLVQYTIDANGYADATPCTVGSLAPVLAKKAALSAVALADDASSVKVAPIASSSAASATAAGSQLSAK